MGTRQGAARDGQRLARLTLTGGSANRISPGARSSSGPGQDPPPPGGAPDIDTSDPVERLDAVGRLILEGKGPAVGDRLAALLAGINCMSWPRFVLYNVTGGILWACVYGFGGYYLGEGASRLAEPVEVALGVAIVILAATGAIFLRRHEARLVEEAQHALPGPLRAPGRPAE